MARSLIQSQTRPGDLIVDPFSGCGVVALEAAIANRRIIAGDWNPYAVLLSRAKLFSPSNVKVAESRLRATWKLSRARLNDQDLRTVPLWVRRFFHPETLRSALAFRDACVERNDDFLLACALAGQAKYIISGDEHLLKLKHYRGARILTPRMFVEDVLA